MDKIEISDDIIDKIHEYISKYAMCTHDYKYNFFNNWGLGFEFKPRETDKGYGILIQGCNDIRDLIMIVNYYGLYNITDEKYFYKNYGAFIKVNSIFFSRKSFDKWKRKNGYLIIDRHELWDNEYLNTYSPGGDASKWSNNELEINLFLDRKENKISLEIDFFDRRGKYINDLKILKVFTKGDGENYKTYLEDKLNIKFK